ncbi:hypothetical protein PRUPE_1G284000 [Prunus persica]|uniref:RRM domain-containing protein n=1 Tax=Prunus persica TaxID=3760 RepID=A0A251R788_PRUPE|nr:hypothetical protein PRUPE_1G284000 [Prunus persica]
MYAHGEIEPIRMLLLERRCAFVTYTTREGAEKVAEDLFNKLVMKAPRQELKGTDKARQQAAAHGGLLPQAVVSQQHNQFQQDQSTPFHYYNIPPQASHETTFFPSMNPRGAWREKFQFRVAATGAALY